LIKNRILLVESQEHTRCIRTIEFQEEDFEETVLTTVDEIHALGKAGWASYCDTAFSGFLMHFYQGT
jgi:hypothetical protein